MRYQSYSIPPILVPKSDETNNNYIVQFSLFCRPILKIWNVAWDTVLVEFKIQIVNNEQA